MNHSTGPATAPAVMHGNVNTAHNADRIAYVPFSFLREASPVARRALIAASLGWMLDAFDVMLYALVLASLIPDLAMDTATAGLLGSLALVASAVGGLLFGIIADRYGRVRALIWSVLIYSIFTTLCGIAQSVTQLALCRLGVGLGMGGEWASGAALVAETWPVSHRGKALGLMQSAWAIGYGLAAIVVAVVLPRWGWRATFFVGILPAIVTLWVRRRVPEPDVWTTQKREAVGARNSVDRPIDSRGRSRPAGLFGVGRTRTTLLLILMNACTMYAWWGLNLWIPAYLSLPPDRGGLGLPTTTMSGLIVAMQIGMWFGYVTFGFASDAIGRKRSYVIYLLAAAALIVVYASTRRVLLLLLLGPLVAFFGTGYFSGFGAVTAELYETRIRATAQGLTYNIGRLASAAAPFIVGSLAQTRGFGTAFVTASMAFLLAALIWRGIPDTRTERLAS